VGEDISKYTIPEHSPATTIFFNLIHRVRSDWLISLSTTALSPSKGLHRLILACLIDSRHCCLASSEYSSTVPTPFENNRLSSGFQSVSSILSKNNLMLPSQILLLFNFHLWSGPWSILLRFSYMEYTRLKRRPTTLSDQPFPIPLHFEGDLSNQACWATSHSSDSLP